MDIKSTNTLEFHKLLGQVAQETSFSAGKGLVSQLKPSADYSSCREKQTETHEASLLLDRSDITIGGARDVREAVANAERGFVLPTEDLLDVRGTIVAVSYTHLTLPTTPYV